MCDSLARPVDPAPKTVKDGCEEAADRPLSHTVLPYFRDRVPRIHHHCVVAHPIELGRARESKGEQGRESKSDGEPRRATESDGEQGKIRES